ncbi:MAG: glycosyltransferase, partial [Planctomycetes bacterium]|nr:glycosyltransferase [Planctomycetota bacterium]
MLREHKTDGGEAAVPLVSAVVASKDRRVGVERLVGDIRRQGYPAEKVEILVVDDGSVEAYELDEGVRMIRHEQALGAQQSRNEGVAAARGELVLMLDDDVELEGDDFIERGVEVLSRQKGVVLVAGRKTDVMGDNGRSRTAEFSVGRLTGYSGDLVRGKAAGGEVDWPNQVYLVRRAALLEVGGYDGIYGLNGGHSFREESDVHARLR